MSVPLAFGIPGARELVIVAIAALVLYGRGGSRLLSATKTGRGLSPWLNLIRMPPAPQPRRPQGTSRTPPPPAKAKGQGRLFWALTILAASAIAAWVATRAFVMSGGLASR